MKIFIFFLFGSFIQRWYIPYGTRGEIGRVIAGDFNYNGQTDLCFMRTDTLHFPLVIFLEYDSLFDTTWGFVVKDSVYAPMVCAGGDFDRDGLYEIVAPEDTVAGIQIFESPDSFSYPTFKVWADTLRVYVGNINVHDIDKDQFPEIVILRVDTNELFRVYEFDPDSGYRTVFREMVQENATSPIAFGDFDRDGWTEFVFGYTGSFGDTAMWVYECNGDNSYIRVYSRTLPSTNNIYDCISVEDADRDGKPEFVLKGFTVPDNEFQVYIFEAAGNNIYQIIDSLYFYGFPLTYFGGISASGDVDGDSIPEIVLEASYNIYILKANANNSFYVFDTIPGYGDGSNIAVYDVDRDGINEIIVSGEGETKIYKWVTDVKENLKWGIENEINLPTFIKAISDLKIKDYKIFNISGQKISSLKSGTYFIKLKNKGKVLKIIKMR